VRTTVSVAAVAVASFHQKPTRSKAKFDTSHLDAIALFVPLAITSPAPSYYIYATLRYSIDLPSTRPPSPSSLSLFPSPSTSPLRNSSTTPQGHDGGQQGRSREEAGLYDYVEDAAEQEEQDLGLVRLFRLYWRYSKGYGKARSLRRHGSGYRLARDQVLTRICSFCLFSSPTATVCVFSPSLHQPLSSTDLPAFHTVSLHRRSSGELSR
jgi:hypothetical protein